MDFPTTITREGCECFVTAAPITNFIRCADYCCVIWSEEQQEHALALTYGFSDEVRNDFTLEVAAMTSIGQTAEYFATYGKQYTLEKTDDAIHLVVVGLTELEINEVVGTTEPDPDAPASEGYSYYRPTTFAQGGAA